VSLIIDIFNLNLKQIKNLTFHAINIRLDQKNVVGKNDSFIFQVSHASKLQLIQNTEVYLRISFQVSTTFSDSARRGPLFLLRRSLRLVEMDSALQMLEDAVETLPFSASCENK